MLDFNPVYISKRNSLKHTVPFDQNNFAIEALQVNIEKKNNSFEVDSHLCSNSSALLYLKILNINIRCKYIEIEFKILQFHFAIG